jgi:hypothetical protein
MGSTMPWAIVAMGLGGKVASEGISNLLVKIE